jgi:hypothetical protein
MEHTQIKYGVHQQTWGMINTQLSFISFGPLPETSGKILTLVASALFTDAWKAVAPAMITERS